ncbi:nucleic acid/nucleotide deaminase domain-containing protein [Actinomadura sp. WMMB 499]|uniref:nucleic acid/nucleotide deaminase domain-containing protein n=1 Tax=Actinomadura sp. WMMB 499 TaxID=1219491 RepID=UPI0012451265|nr:nucleic acid/nucleotide deaminase domain-containing protein [Actinomadura sp. WMMB 499]QFG22480.1 hypothetical protein F7P10_16465 [Actinomadura sp. WMMB 499]
MTPRGGRGRARSRARNQAAQGIFGKSAGELFRVSGAKGNVIGLDPTKIGKKTRDGWAKKRPSRVPPEGDRVKSRKIDPDSPNLSRRDREMADAIKATRKHNGHDRGSNNYAAIRYIDSDGNRRILVTHSDGVHSERMGANYLLDQGIPKRNILDLATERSPCDKRSAYCDQWMKLHIPKTPSTHYTDYDINGTSRSAANRWVDGWARRAVHGS